MKKEWKEYYLFLERLRKSGVTNMFGAAPYLQAAFNIDSKLARLILANWMDNYSEIKKEYYEN